MTDKTITLYQDLISDFTNSIDSLQIKLSKIRDLDEAHKLTTQIQSYQKLLQKLKEDIK